MHGKHTLCLTPCAEGCTSAYGLANELLRLRAELDRIRSADVNSRAAAVYVLKIQYILSDLTPLDPDYLDRMADKIGALPSAFDEEYRPELRETLLRMGITFDPYDRTPVVLDGEAAQRAEEILSRRNSDN